eukprot:1930335-Pleurochrysis_carterae.AAC.2
MSQRHCHLAQVLSASGRYLACGLSAIAERAHDLHKLRGGEPTWGEADISVTTGQGSFWSSGGCKTSPLLLGSHLSKLAATQKMNPTEKTRRPLPSSAVPAVCQQRLLPWCPQPATASRQLSTGDAAGAASDTSCTPAVPYVGADRLKPCPDVAVSCACVPCTVSCACLAAR